jgi:EAL domain-containing protein (putative c-di-GMP-specific phosphodiesterase class I)
MEVSVMAPIVWLALLLGYFAGLGGAFLLLPGPVIEPLYGVLGLVTLLVVVTTAILMVAAGRRAVGRSAEPGHAAPGHDPGPGAGAPPEGEASDHGPSSPEGSEGADDPDAGHRPRGETSHTRLAAEGSDGTEAPAERFVAAAASDGTDDAVRPEGRHGSALLAPSYRAEAPIDARELQSLLLEGRVDALLRPLLGWPERPVELYHAVARLRAADGSQLAPAQYVSSARRAGLGGLIDAILVLRAAQLIWEAGTEGRELCVLAPVSPPSLNDPSFVLQLERLIARHPDLPGRLVLELDQLRLDAPATQAQARLRRLGWRFCLRRIGPPVFELAALAVRGFSFLRLEAPRFARAATPATAPAELRSIQKRLGDQGITILVDRQDAAPTLVTLADRPLVLDGGLLLEEARQSAA